MLTSSTLFACFIHEQDEKAKLQAALQQVNAGSSASEAQMTEMRETIETLRCGLMDASMTGKTGAMIKSNILSNVRATFCLA